ncbi:MAG TPA: nitronate monooxygenase [Roseiarcus sp.]|nr:nitronate monooxygenase [Roseiarcus sp.]
MLRTRFCDHFGIEAPIVVAPMGPDLTGVELVAAVSNAGGFGILQAQLCPPARLRDEIKSLRALTSRPFGVNFVLHFPHEDGVRVCIEERVGALSLFWGDPTPFIEPARQAGVSIIVQVGSVDDAIRAARAGADVIIAQGIEAGGHGSGSVSTIVLVPRVVDAVAPTIVLASGGVADARGVVAALALGADGVTMGTRFLATPEANAHALYKQSLVAASEEDTVRTILFGNGWPNAPHRALRTRFVETWLPSESETQSSDVNDPPIGETSIAGMVMPVSRFAAIPPNAAARGEIESMELLAGQSVGLVNDVKPAGEIVRGMMAEARRIIETLAR